MFTTFLNALLLVFVRHMVQQIHRTDSFLRILHLLTWSRNSMLCMECSFLWAQNPSWYTMACYYCIQGIKFQDLRSLLQCCWEFRSSAKWSFVAEWAVLIHYCFILYIMDTYKFLLLCIIFQNQKLIFSLCFATWSTKVEVKNKWQIIEH